VTTWLTLSATFIFLILAVYYFRIASSNKDTKKRVATWFEGERKIERKSVVLLIGDKYDKSELAEDLQRKLVQADLKLKPSEYMGIYFMAFAFIWFVNHFLLELDFPLDATLAYFIVWLGSKMFLNSRQNKRSESFNKQLPEVCRMMSNAIKAGLTIPQGIELVGRDIKAPAGPEFQIMDQQLRLGDDFEEVMDRFRERVLSKDLNIFVSTILIQRKVGGNLTEVLSLMAQTLEERARVNKEVDTVTAESKFVAYILPIMPLMMAMMMNLFIPGFLNPLFTPLGLILLAVFLAMQLFAFMLIKKVTKIRV
jgi:tight adherence protein B